MTNISQKAINQLLKSAEDAERNQEALFIHPLSVIALCEELIELRKKQNDWIVSGKFEEDGA